MFVRPAIDAATGKPLAVRFPRTLQLLAPEGGEVPGTVFWLRRLRQGDVLRVTPPAAPREAVTE